MGRDKQQVPQGWLALYTQVGKQQLLVPYISPQIPLVMYSFTDFIVAIGYPQCHALTSFQCPMSTSWMRHIRQNQTHDFSFPSNFRSTAQGGSLEFQNLCIELENVFLELNET